MSWRDFSPALSSSSWRIRESHDDEHFLASLMLSSSLWKALLCTFRTGSSMGGPFRQRTELWNEWGEGRLFLEALIFTTVLLGTVMAGTNWNGTSLSGMVVGCWDVFSDFRTSHEQLLHPILPASMCCSLGPMHCRVTSRVLCIYTFSSFFIRSRKCSASSVINILPCLNRHNPDI
jgi:hypothetical protein